MDDQRQKDQAQGMDEWQARLGWPALRSALVFANERIKCMRHTEAVSNCEHCNFGYIVSWVQRQIDTPISSLSPGTTEGGNTWQPIESAPKDGTWFLAWGEDCGFCVYRMGPGFITGEDPQPTHWMRLPARP